MVLRESPQAIDLSYRPGRSADWLKAKCVLSDIFVIVGYQPDDRDRVANLKLATRDADGSLHYVRRGQFAMCSATALANARDTRPIDLDDPKREASNVD